jgi:SAM-dependent methyltransferase
MKMNHAKGDRVAQQNASTLRSVPCPRCGAERSRVVVEGRDYLYGVAGRFRAAECDACGLWFQNPRPLDAELPDLYPTAYEPHSVPAPPVEGTVSAGRARFLRRHFGYHDFTPGATRVRDWRAFTLFDAVRHWTVGQDLIPRYVVGGRLLELGCGSGARLRLLHGLGWQRVQGVEFVPAAADRARALGFEITCAPVEEALDEFPDECLDVVVSSMLLEHLRNPFDVVSRIATRLKPGGQFLFSTITRDSLDARIYGRFWAGFDFPRHLVYLRTSDIVRMLEHRFEHVEFFYHADPIDFVRGSTWRANDGKATLLDRAVLAMRTSLPARLCLMVLARLGLTCRVSVRCRRRSG